MDKRELRLSLKEKLDHRRELMRENSGLRNNLGRERARNEFLLNTIANPLVDMALEDCADHIMQAVIDHAVKASEVIADQTLDRGDYEVGISIPSLHIRRRLFREDVRLAADRAVRDIPIRRVDYSGN